MQGRYGGDQLNLFLVFSSVAIQIVGLFLPVWFTLIGWIPLVWALFRMFSRNIAARREENMRFLRMAYAVRTWFARLRTRMKEGREYRYYRCPECRQKVRVPRNLGKIKITCPKCGAKFEKKT